VEIGTGKESAVVTRARHREQLERCVAHLNAYLAITATSDNHIDSETETVMRSGIEIAAEELRCAMRALGRLTGSVNVEDLLDVVFRDFCIGK
jgi:tRNA modification GTPase